MHYRLLTLGQAGLAEDGGASIDFPMGKPFGILAYLALSSDPVSRDELAAVFWGSGDRSRARHSLRQALSFIRSRLGEEVFASDDPVALEPTLLDADVDQLQQALRDAETDRILEVYRGPFLETFQLASTPAWDHWVEIQRRILEERVAVALRDAAARAESPGRAVDLLRRVVEIEPHRTGHRAALIDRLLEQGEIEAATAVLAEARQADVDDGVDLGELEERIRSAREHRSSSPGTATELTPEFVGRTAELASLTASWREAVRGNRRIAILNGPTGIGKTRLAEELAALVSGTGHVVHVKASTMERRLDWSVTAELARSLYRLPGAAGIGAGAMNVLRSLVPSLGGSGEPSPSVTPRPVALSDALADLVSAVAYEAPLLLILDDMQWVDRSSLTLLLRMIRQLRDEPVMAVLTFRSEELGSREYDAIKALVAEESATVTLLHTLGESEVQEMLALNLAEPTERVERLARRLHEVTRGHPLFLVELLRSLRDDGVLVRTEDGWQFSEPSPAELQLPASVRLVIDKRLDQLSDPARRVGTELASLPPSAGLERVRTRTGLSDADFTHGLNELVDRAVLSWDPAGRLVFTHDQLREAMAEDRPRRLRRRVAAIGAGAAILVAVLALVAFGLSRDTYGTGDLLVQAGDSLLVADRSGPPDAWTLQPSGIWYPADPEVFSGPYARRLTDGSVAWFGSVHGGQKAPEGVVYRGENSDRIVLEWPGDDGVSDISPDGRYLLWITEHRQTPEWDMELRIRDVSGGSGRVLAGPGSRVQARWSPDGMRIAVALAQEEDSLLVISPAGERLYAFTAFQINLEDWCSRDEILAVIRETPTAPFVRSLIDTRTDSTIVLDRNASQSAVCSPDGEYYVSRELVDGRRVPVLTELDTRQRWPLPENVADIGRLYWLPDAVDPIPVRIRIGEDSTTLEQGGQARVVAHLVLSDGSEQVIRPELTSSDPAVVSTRGHARVIGNRPGTARVVAHYGGWLADTLMVRVTPNDRNAAVLVDDFRSLDTLRWIPVGEPTATVRDIGGRNVLELLGDGRYADGLVTRDALTLRGGATVELEFQMPLTRDEYQGFIVRLGRMDPPSGSSRDAWSSWSRGEIVTVRYPAFELDKWSPRLIGLHVLLGAEAVDWLPEETDPGSWTHLALQVQPDGLASMWIDRQFVASIVTPPGFLDQPLRVAIFGRTRDTHGYVRNFTWWAEPRYR